MGITQPLLLLTGNQILASETYVVISRNRLKFIALAIGTHSLLLSAMQWARSIDNKHLAIITNSLAVVIIDHRAFAPFVAGLS